jgi:RHS repeat-associated protein
LPELDNPLKTHQRGLKLYELKNLPIAIGIGNVISVISDRLLSTGPNSNNKVNKFEAETCAELSRSIVRYSDYYPFGFEMAGRADNSESYRYGFNGMEKDNEVIGDANSYTTEFRTIDVRIGRWWSRDPITHEFQSPYCTFDNNPIYYKDPSGADGEGDAQTGDLTATIYIRFEDGMNLTQQEIQDYINNFANNIRDTWDNQTIDGVQVNTDNVRVLIAPEGMNEAALDRNENLLTVGTGRIADPNSIPNAFYINSNSRRNTGYMYYQNQGSDAAHEFGHMLGLSDRYYEGVVTNRSDYEAERMNVPIAFEESGYNYQTNLMSSSGGSLTDKQLNIAFNRNKFEKSYSRFALIHYRESINNITYDAVLVGAFKTKFYSNNNLTYTIKNSDNFLDKYNRSSGKIWENNEPGRLLREYIRDNNLWP